MKAVWDFDELYSIINIDGKDFICHAPSIYGYQVYPMQGLRDYLLNKIFIKDGFEYVARFFGNVNYKGLTCVNTYCLEIL